MADDKGSRITIYRIAQEAGVSAATVSRVLNGTQQVSSDKRQRIEEIIRRYDYRPSAIARSLTGQQARVLGFIQPDIAHPYYNALFLAAEQRALEHGYAFFLGNTLNDNSRHNNNMERQYLRLMQEKHVDGVLIAGGRIHDNDLSDEYKSEFRSFMATTAVATVSGQLSWVDCPSVSANEAAGMSLIVNYLVSLRHKKIGFLGGYAADEPTRSRLDTFCRSLSEHGLEYREEWHFEGAFGIEEGRASMEALLQVRDKPTAVLCFNDLNAIGAIFVAQKHGLNIPRDISIAGVDNIRLAESVYPGITTVDLHCAEQGRLAVDVLLDALASRDDPARDPVVPHLQIDPTLAIRGSVGAPPG